MGPNDMRAYEALAEHAKLGDLVVIARHLLGGAGEARRADWADPSKVKAKAEELNVAYDDAATPFGNALTVLARGPEGAEERALAGALWAHVLAETPRKTSEDEHRAAIDLLWLATRTPFDATGLVDRALGENADDLWTALADRIRYVDEGKLEPLGRGEALCGCAALLMSKSGAAAKAVAALAGELKDPALARVLASHKEPAPPVSAPVPPPVPLSPPSVRAIPPAPPSVPAVPAVPAVPPPPASVQVIPPPSASTAALQDAPASVPAMAVPPSVRAIPEPPKSAPSLPSEAAAPPVPALAAAASSAPALPSAPAIPAAAASVPAIPSVPEAPPVSAPAPASKPAAEEPAAPPASARPAPPPPISPPAEISAPILSITTEPMLAETPDERMSGEVLPTPRGPVVTAILAVTGLLFVIHGARIVARLALAYKRPAEVTLSRESVRIKARTEMLGRTLREREILITRSGLARATREVRYPRMSFYAGLLALAVGSYVGVATLVDGVRAASPSLLLTGLVIVAAGIGLDFLLGSLAPGATGRVRVAFVPRKGPTVCIGNVDAKRADAALRKLSHAR